MPIYEFACHDCGHRLEALRRLGQGAEGLTCPECGSSRLEKQFSTFASAVAGAPAPAMAPAGGCCRGPGFT